MKHSKKDQKQIHKLSLKQKTKLRLIVAGISVIIITAILLIYINMHKTEEMKANETAVEIAIDKPVDMIVPHVMLKQDSAVLRTVNYKIAKPLSTPLTIQK